jgi:hypothetical protein
MVFKTGKHFDAIREQEFLNFDKFGLNYEIRSKNVPMDDSIQKSLWIWCESSQRHITCGYICAADSMLLQSVTDITAYHAKLSLERDEWRGYTRPLNEKELRQQYYLDVGKVFDKTFEDRVEAWTHAHSVLNYIHWLRTGEMDYTAIQLMFTAVIDGVKMYDGGDFDGRISNMDATRLMAMSAWPQIFQHKAKLESRWGKLPKDATLATAIMLAEDPSQLHDPKSPVRKKARSYMRGNMSQNWLARGLATTASDWLRTFEWREGESGLSPREVMLRAYAYMPEVEAPDNIAAEVASLRKIPI